MAHTCKALVIHCMDFRFGRAIKAWLEEQYLLGDCDLVVLAGAAKNIADPADPAEFATIMKQVRLSKQLHNVRTVVLMNHTDCGGYGGRASFPDRDAERARHKADMAKAAEIIRTQYSDLEVRTVLADIEADGAISFIS